jgi:hypothetical protein
VYKCLTPSGGVIYSNKPCPGALRKEGNEWINVEEENRKKHEEEEERARQAQLAQEREQQKLRSEKEARDARRASETQVELDIDPRTQCDEIMKGKTKADRSWQPVYGPCCKNAVAMRNKEAMYKCMEGTIGLWLLEMQRRGVKLW